MKELMDNSLDAGASAITIEIKEGGISMIRITDNGAGIAKEEIPTAFLRHATSKIRNTEDLLSVTSLGFRGEALSSIAAVAQVELITKRKEDIVGTRYSIEGGKETGCEEVGCPEGTTFVVRNLFYNTPARRKFLKSKTTEGNYIHELVQRYSLAHADIRFSFIVDGKTKVRFWQMQPCRDIRDFLWDTVTRLWYSCFRLILLLLMSMSIRPKWKSALQIRWKFYHL